MHVMGGWGVGKDRGLWQLFFSVSTAGLHYMNTSCHENKRGQVRAVRAQHGQRTAISQTRIVPTPLNSYNGMKHLSTTYEPSLAGRGSAILYIISCGLLHGTFSSAQAKDRGQAIGLIDGRLVVHSSSN